MIYTFYLSLGVSFTWVPVCLSASRVWQPVLRSVSLVMPVCVVQHSSLVCSSVWSWFSSSPRCWVSTVWLWPFTCTRNKSINSTTHTQHVDKTAQQSTRRTTLTTSSTTTTTQVKSVWIIYHPTRITNKQQQQHKWNEMNATVWWQLWWPFVYSKNKNKTTTTTVERSWVPVLPPTN